jgi:Kef-type K+ transport system membrane component KefB
MHENIWFIAAIWMGLAFIASLISIRVGISVALIEIVVGVVVGNIHFNGGQHILQTTDWINFLAMLGSGVLTFLAGAEIDPVSLRANLRASMTIGVVSFLLPVCLRCGCSRNSCSAGRCIRRKSPASRCPPRPSPSFMP